uniref:Uncharacterized protein n=1 Tax=Chlamydomonas chlamydogama TaxID=225041 RepID=A0A7S2QTR7_9CHLO|mmetsp:Transcript_1945/g.4320  ORF Transcript_1945/g.4320 Transcript_1945/m.4320 type:complete len:186 (+) Transcript_1945:170-727(+)
MALLLHSSSLTKPSTLVHPRCKLLGGPSTSWKVARHPAGLKRSSWELPAWEFPSFTSEVSQSQQAQSAPSQAFAVKAEESQPLFEGALEMALMLIWGAALLMSATALVQYCMAPSVATRAASAAAAQRLGTSGMPMMTLLLRALAATTGVTISGLATAVSTTFSMLSRLCAGLFVSVAGSLLHLI